MAELIAVDMGALGEGLHGNEHAVSICAKDSDGEVSTISESAAGW